ncbi:hypothetical protein ACQ4LE_004897 [Meloidogyne hapla]|uniref:Uncharacterized protein n=1 Tax=Meloidogyne hapla TaxID=6305 RepID=A0A1I8BCY1_MELHA
MSDFDPKYFSKEENKMFGKVLERLREFERSVAHSLRKMEEKIEEVTVNENKNRKGLLATKGEVSAFGSKIWEKIKEIELNLNGAPRNDLNFNTGVNNVAIVGENPEVMVSDPFLNNGVFIENFDGNPSKSFKKWAENFLDVLSLVMTPLTEQQKIIRLRFCLAG